MVLNTVHIYICLIALQNQIDSSPTRVGVVMVTFKPAIQNAHNN